MCSAFYYWFELRLIFLGFLLSPLGPAPKTLRLKWKWKVLIKSTIYPSLKIDPKSTWGLAGSIPGNNLLSCLKLQVFKATRAVKSCISVTEICKILSVSSSSVPAQTEIWGMKHIGPSASFGQELQVLSARVSRKLVYVMWSPLYLMCQSRTGCFYPWRSWIHLRGYWPSEAVTLWLLRTETTLSVCLLILPFYSPPQQAF